MTFYDNGIQYDQRQFKLLPQIKEGNVPRYDQTQYDDQYDGLSDMFFTPIPISKKGCALTSLAMILAYHGVTGPSGALIKPDELNTLLKDNAGYTYYSGGIKWNKVSEITNGRVKFSRSITYDNLEQSICQYGPQMVGAEGSAHVPNSHFMVTTGLNAD